MRLSIVPCHRLERERVSGRCHPLLSLCHHPLTGSVRMAPPKKMQPQQSTFDPSYFWKRENWYLSNTVNYVCGNVLITEGTYKSPQPVNGQPSKPSGWILIFSKIGEDRATDPEASGSRKLTEDKRLPPGHAISIAKWPDFVRAFARFFMVKESKCLAEICQMFDLEKRDFAKDKKFEDWDGKQVENNPKRNNELVLYSIDKADAIREVLAELPRPGIIDDDKFDQVSDDDEFLLNKNASEDEEEEEEEEDDGGDDDEEGDDDDDDEDDDEDGDDDDDDVIIDDGKEKKIPDRKSVV